MAKTIEATVGDLALRLHVPMQELVQIARVALKRDSVNENYRIKKNQEQRIEDAWKAKAQSSGAALERIGVVAPPETDSIADSPMAKPMRDVRPEFDTLHFKDLGFQVWCHVDVYEGISTRKHLSQRTAMALRQIIAFGKTSVVKGCSDQRNRGWLRTPLGSGSENHYYLWWAKQGSRVLKEFPVGKNDIVIRSIRHHDNHDALAAGMSTEDYLPLDRQDLSSGVKDFESPWNPEQNHFINGDAPIRLAIGQPGSGKTTVLWEAVGLRTDQKVLYLTWSPRLVAEALRHFEAFAPIGTNIQAYDFATLLGHICKRDAVRKAMDASRADFESILPRDNRAGILGPWAQRTEALYAEVRANWVGSAKHRFVENPSDHRSYQWSPRSYREDTKAIERLGERAADAVVKIVEEIEKGSSLAEVFPELEIAASAMQALGAGGLPKRFEQITRLVVDEIQDLTRLELSVVLEICDAIGRASGRRPFLLMAGDEGQTVRPSGFAWNSASDLVTERIGPPERFQLHESVRYPSRIAEVLDRATQLYGNLPKDERPRRQTRGATGDHRLAEVFHVAVQEQADGVDLLRNLTAQDDAAVIYASENIPPWVMEKVGQGVLTPVETKGLEYQTVCVINPGHQLKVIGDATREIGDPFESLYRRTQIDQLRVAMSRATETLIFVDIAASNEEIVESRRILGHPASWDAPDLLAHISNPESTQEDRVATRIREAQVLLEVRPARAWQLTVQALDMLGQPQLHNGVSDPNLRQEAAKSALSIAAKLLAEGLPKDVLRGSVDAATKTALDELSSATLDKAFNCLLKWLDDDGLGPFDMLDSLVKSDESEVALLIAALTIKSQRLKSELDAGAKEGATAGRYSGDVEEWLRLCGFGGDAGQETASLRRCAIDTLIDKQAGNDALRLLGNIAPFELPEDQYRLGKAKELLGKWQEAAQAFELAETYGDAVRCWRNAAEWNQATAAAKKGNIQDPVLGWLVAVDASINSKPIGQANQLHENEKARLGELKKMLRWP